MSSKTFKGLTALAVSTSMLAISAPAFAQLDEIIVTAEKRSENLQDVAIAITAFDLEALETNRIQGIEDLATFAPGVYITPSPADPTGVRVNIRGVGTFDPQVGQDSRVAIYQDGVYLGKTQGLAVDQPDLARVEIVKGPQGTLYGRNTVAGAINLISASPDSTEYTGRLRAEYGNFNHKKVSGALNVPLGGTAAVRVSGLYLDRDGWVDNEGPGTDFGGDRKYGFRGAVGFDVEEDVSVQFTADYNKTEKEPLFYQSVTGFGENNPLFGPAITTSEGRQDEVTTSFAPERGDSVTKGVSAIVDWRIAEEHDVKFTAAYREANSSRFVSLVPTADPAIINAITGGFNQAIAPLPFAFGVAGQALRPDFGTQFDGSIPDQGLFLSQPGGTDSLDDHDQTSLELTYNGDFLDGRLEFTGGAFYYDESTGVEGGANLANANDYLFVLGQFSPLVTAPNISAFIGGLDAASGQNPAGPVPFPVTATGPIPAAGILLGALQGGFGATPGAAFPLIQQLVGNGTTCAQTGMTPMPTNNFCIPTLSVALNSALQTTTNDLRIDTTAYALYGQATYHLTDDFRIIAGLRYSDESKDGFGQTKSAFFNDNITLTGNVIEPNIASFDEDFLDPAVTLEYDFSDDILLYASYKESFRSGGFNATASAFRTPGETFGADFTFGSETLTAYEGGFKGEFIDKIRLNVSGFYYDFDDRQNTLGTNPLIATERVIVNVDDEIYGVEAEGQFAVTDEITLAGSYSYIDGTAGDITNPFTGEIDPSSRSELQGTPKNSFLLSANYDGNNGIFGNVSFSYKDDVLLIPANDLRLPSISLVNGRVGYNFDMANGNRATFAVWSQNLLDEDYLIDSLPFETFAFRTQVFGLPRTYGVSLGLDF
ncbi:TonB-dependent receptor [Hellea sp.]|nr:TonB-dependent receptor [Hellea sp.]